MFLAQLRIENFRVFGEGAHAMVLPLTPGLTALIGENDTGKTAIIDALRFVLGTRDHEYFRVEESDFHIPSDTGQPSTEIRISCKFDGLTIADRGAFSEHLTYEDRSSGRHAVLYVNWKAIAMRPSGVRRYTSVEVRSGKAADGPQLEQSARVLLCATYLRPLRDAERAMSAGRGSRLSQILQHTKEIREHGEEYDPVTGPPPSIDKLSVRGIGDYANALLSKHEGVRAARDSLNTKYLAPLSFAGDRLQGHISVSGSKGDVDARLRALLEKLDLELRDGPVSNAPAVRGLGSNNILFMACELLLLGSEADSFPILLIEEPEAHLHPQRQLRLVQFLQEISTRSRADSQQIQIIITTHNPNLASAIDLDNLVLLHGRRAFPLAYGHTELELSDYRFLSRFLDATKSNLFFARGLLIVEGDAENILVPTIAKLLGRDFTEHGVSIVNVGSTGLRRFARIFMRKNPTHDGIVSVPVACLADFDVLPDCAPEILGRVKTSQGWPELKGRKWRAQRDFTTDALLKRRATIKGKASAQRVQTFVADECTLEYDLAFSGLSREVWIAACLSCDDERVNSGKQKAWKVIRSALKSYSEIASLDKDELASRVYAKVESGSKPIVAQHLAYILEWQFRRHQLHTTSLRAALPKYLIEAIEYVTPQAATGTSTETGPLSG